MINPLTTNDDYSRHRNSAACYQLAQSVLKIGSALAERVGQGEVGGCTALADSAWRLLQLAIERAWSALDGPFFCFLVQTSVENGAFTLYGLHFWLFRQLSVWRSAVWSEGPDCWALGNEWVWSGSWTCKELLKEAVDQVSWANSWQKWKYRWKKVGLVCTRLLRKLI